jgi:hypothetical protein
MGYQVKSLGFSKSGGNLVVAFFDNEFPDVISLEHQYIFQNASKAYSTGAQSTRKGKEKSLVQDSFDETSLAKCPIGILTETSLSDTTARIVHNEDSIVLDLKSPAGVKTGVELLTLPQWQHLSDASASVICPQTKQEKIGIVLSAAADPLFDYIHLHIFLAI